MLDDLPQSTKEVNNKTSHKTLTIIEPSQRGRVTLTKPKSIEIKHKAYNSVYVYILFPSNKVFHCDNILILIIQ